LLFVADLIIHKFQKEIKDEYRTKLSK